MPVPGPGAIPSGEGRPVGLASLSPPESLRARGTGQRRLTDGGREAPRHGAWRSIPTRSTSRCSGAFSGIGSESVPLGGIIEPWLDQHAEAIAAHARMLWGDGARDLARVWVTGGGGELLGSRPSRPTPSSSATPGCSTPWGTSAAASACPMSPARRPTACQPESARTSGRFPDRFGGRAAPNGDGPSRRRESRPVYRSLYFNLERDNDVEILGWLLAIPRSHLTRAIKALLRAGLSSYATTRYPEVTRCLPTRCER
jgi:hypothetical protein